jgi:phosphoribosylaminoimidazole-succinocarboxamide synthase
MSIDKQFVHDYLETLNWGKVAPALELLVEVVMETKAKYHTCYEILTGMVLS